MLKMGGAVAAVESAYMKQQLVAANTRRLRAIESGERTVVGVNAYTETEPSPLTAGQSILVVDESAEREQIEALRAFRVAAQRRGGGERAASARRCDRVRPQRDARLDPRRARGRHHGRVGRRAAQALRRVPRADRRRRGASRPPRATTPRRCASACARSGSELGRPLKLLVGKPGLDGHSNGAEQIAVKARDVGIEVVYEGIRLTPEEIASSARDEGVHVIGLSILSGSHGVLVVDVLERLRAAGCGDAAGRGRRDHPRGGRARAARRGRRARVHAQGLRPHADHGRDRRRRRGVARCRLTCVERLQQRDRAAVAARAQPRRRPAPGPARRGARAARRARARRAVPGQRADRRDRRAGRGQVDAARRARARAAPRRARRVAVVAVDPSSQRTGGALLGDRIRMRSSGGDAGVFIRSMAARDRLGGIAEQTWAAVAILAAAFDRVFVETVGVGQSEAAVADLVDTLVFVANPGQRRHAPVHEGRACSSSSTCSS